MTPARWQHVREILYGASQVEAPRRTRYLAEQCGSDEALRTEVEELLAALGDSGGFLESPVRIFSDSDEPISSLESRRPSDPASPKHIGRRIGVYQLLEEIGRGGMGEVYRAVRVDGLFEKEVAVKMVRGGSDGAFILQRFRLERQVLAMLEHPNIARLLDGGTTEEGIPYLVMELIEGTPVDQYCREHGLTVNARLRLFNEVCAAVQYAHQRLVIHRDIKPGNILVTAEGVPKLLDFGVAKLVDPAGGTGATLLVPMTPEYASPEQILGEPITTASDVYSLGVVLYLLLTGRLPYPVDRRNLAELARATTDREPERPSAAVLRSDTDSGPIATTAVSETSPAKLRRRLRGDLDTIVLKALRKEPQLRYSSVEQFSEDIRREMQGMPVEARKGSWNHRAGKFLRRHKIGMAAAALVGIAIIGGIAATVREARIAAANAQRAERRFNDVRALATSNLFELNDAIEKLPVSASARHLLIQRALEYLDKLRTENDGDRDLMRQTALGYERIAELQGRFSGNGVGDVNSSIASYRKALTIHSRLVELSHQAPDEVESELRVLGPYTRNLLLSGDLAGCLHGAQTALALSLQLVKQKPHDPQARLAYANANMMSARALGGDGSSPNTRQFDAAIAHDRAAIDTLAQLNASDSSLRPRLVSLRLMLALHYWKSRAFEQSLETLNGVLVAETPQSTGLVGILRALNWRGNAFDRMGDHRRALQDYRQGLLFARSVSAARPDDLDARLDLNILTGLSAIEEARLGNPRAASKPLNEALSGIEQLFASNPESFYRRILIVGYSFRGEILSSLGDQNAARANLSRSLSMAEDLAKHAPDDLDAVLQMARSHAALGVLWGRSSRFADARRELSTSRTLAKQLLASRPADREILSLAGTVESELAVLWRCPEETPCRPATHFPLPSLLE